MRAVLDRVSDWWGGLSDRERWMLMGLGALVAALAFWYGLLTPLQRWAGAAAERHAEAAETLAEAERIAAEAAALERDRKAAAGSAADAVHRTAEGAGVRLLREEPGARGALNVWTDLVEVKPLFVWLAALQRDHSVGVRTFEAHRSEAGKIDARIGFAGDGG